MSDLVATSGRSVKFTPERFDQIRNLVERGMSREEIAETVGCTLGSLQVTCSRAGISLRRPRPDNGVTRLPRRATTERTKMNNDNAKQLATLSLRLRYKGREKEVSVPLSDSFIGQLVLEASFHDGDIGELVAKLVAEALAARIKKEP